MNILESRLKGKLHRLSMDLQEEFRCTGLKIEISVSNVPSTQVSQLSDSNMATVDYGDDKIILYNPNYTPFQIEPKSTDFDMGECRDAFHEKHRYDK